MEKPELLDAEEIRPREQAEQDHQWTRIVNLELVPHPAQPRPEIVARDFGIKDGVLSLRLRAAIAGYVLQQWNVDCSPDHSLDQTSYRLWLRDSLVLCVVAYTADIDFDIQFVGGIKTALFGGEGLFFAVLRGPGTIWLQSLPFNRLASRIFAAAPVSKGGSGSGGEQGGILGSIFNGKN